MVYFDKQRTHRRHGTELLSWRSHRAEILNPLFYEIDCCEGQDHEIKSELVAHTDHNFLCQENHKSWVVLVPCRDQVLREIKQTTSDVHLFYSFLELQLDGVYQSCSVSSRTLISIAYWQDTSILSLHLLSMNYLPSLTQCCGIDMVFSFFFFSDWNIPMSNL